MKEKFLNSSMKLIKNNHNYSKEQLEIIEYGLEGLYSFVTKSTIILLLNLLVGTIKEFVAFFISFALIRAFAFGVHAKTNIGCWITSIIVNVGIPLLIKYFFISKIYLIIISVITTIIISIFAPADTRKRPLKNINKRRQDKILAIIVSIIYLIMIILLNDYIIYCLTYALLYESIMVNPLTYMITKQSYNNYKK